MIGHNAVIDAEYLLVAIDIVSAPVPDLAGSGM
jgi:hypothetical protein